MVQHHYHHHHRDPEKVKKEKRIRNTSVTFFVLAILALLPYLAIEYLPFLTSIQAHHKVNFSTMCYAALRAAMVLIPIIMVAPSKMYRNLIDKINLIGKMMSLTSFLFFSGLVADIMSYNIFGGYIDIGEDPIMIKMLYGHIGMTGIVICFIEGFIYLMLSKKIKEHKKDVVILFAIAYAVYLIVPFICLFINKVPAFTKEWFVWFNKNIYIWISNIFTVSALAIAAQSRRVWSEVLWK